MCILFLSVRACASVCVCGGRGGGGGRSVCCVCGGGGRACVLECVCVCVRERERERGREREPTVHFILKNMCLFSWYQFRLQCTVNIPREGSSVIHCGIKEEKKKKTCFAKYTRYWSMSQTMVG